MINLLGPVGPAFFDLTGRGELFIAPFAKWVGGDPLMVGANTQRKPGV